MKKPLSYLIATFVVVNLSSCFFNSLMNGKEKLSEKDFQEVTINDEYSINVPKYMESTKELNDEASLQYQNERKETYVIIIDEYNEDVLYGIGETETYDSTRSLLQNYRDVQLDHIKSSLKVLEEGEIRSEKIHDMEAELIELDGKNPEVILPITYIIGFIQAEEKLFMITCWTMRARKDKYRDTFEQIIRSFKVISKENS